MDRARAEAELADPEKAKDADELATKTLLEQILLKMKNLREELSKNSTLRDALVSGLGETGPTPTPTPSPSPDPDPSPSPSPSPSPNPNPITESRAISGLEICGARWPVNRTR